MAEPITLNVRDVALAAKRAYDEGRLSAQGPTPMCKYRDPSGLPCAIGAALSDEDAAWLDRDEGEDGETFDTDVRSIMERGQVASDNVDRLLVLQRAHDSWAGAVGDRAEARRIVFLDTLNSILAEG